jgi:hypothetical protein
MSAHATTSASAAKISCAKDCKMRSSTSVGAAASFGMSNPVLWHGDNAAAVDGLLIVG